MSGCENEKYVHKGVNGMKRKWKRKTIWAYLDGEKLVDVVQAALDNNKIGRASCGKECL